MLLIDKYCIFLWLLEGVYTIQCKYILHSNNYKQGKKDKLIQVLLKNFLFSFLF